MSATICGRCGQPLHFDGVWRHADGKYVVTRNMTGAEIEAYIDRWGKEPHGHVIDDHVAEPVLVSR